MKQITESNMCCGCEACASICPSSCISMIPDSHGFKHPEINENLCIDCNLCVRTCPSNQRVTETANNIEACFAAFSNDNENRLNSSSGGIFGELVKHVLSKNGIVFAAKFDSDWNVRHEDFNNLENLKYFQGSKYVQSSIINCYRETKKYLVEGIEVMFTGTPCQIAGLKSFLKTDYPNLITVEIICHGVPSPLIWNTYINGLIKDLSSLSNSYNKIKIHDCLFRSKRLGWKNIYFSIIYSDDTNEIECYKIKSSDCSYLDLFLNNIGLRNSCYSCKFKSTNSKADITIGDFWGIDKLYPQFDDDKGCSAIIARTQKSLSIINSLNITKIATTYGDICKENKCLVQSSSFDEDANRKFWLRYLKASDKYKYLQNIYAYNDSLFLKLLRKFRYLISRIFG